MDITSAVHTLTESANTLFILIGAIMVLAMHAGFAFLEVGTVRHKNQVNALVKIMTDFGVSAVLYFFVGYYIAYGSHFMTGAAELTANNGYELVKFFFLMTCAAAIPAIVSGGIAERARFYPMLVASGLIVGLVYPFFEGLIWNGNYGFQNWLESQFGAPFHDFAGSDLMHPVGALITGGIAGALFVYLFEWAQARIERLDDVLGVWPLHGVCGVWGAIACGIFGQPGLGGLGGVSLGAQLAGSVAGVAVAFVGGLVVYGGIKQAVGLRLSDEEEFNGADLSIHRIGANAID